MSHYDYLDRTFPSFLKKLGINFEDRCPGIIVSHGDKCYAYEGKWEENNISFEHGVSLYLLTYLRPWSEEVRETKNGWVDPSDWVINNYEKFKDLLY